jgi:hypothetical protein
MLSFVKVKLSLILVKKYANRTIAHPCEATECNKVWLKQITVQESRNNNLEGTISNTDGYGLNSLMSRKEYVLQPRPPKPIQYVIKKINISVV